jgi:hypothetical protein
LEGRRLAALFLQAFASLPQEGGETPPSKGRAMHLVAVQEFTYANQPLKPGDRFIAPAGDAAILKDGLNPRAIDDPNPDLLVDKVMTTTSAAPIVPTKRSRYRRTDMRAED